MDPEDHRAHTVAGLHQLADFLYEYDDSAALNTACGNDVTYYVLNPDADEARAEFDDRAAFLSEYGGPLRFAQTSREHEGTVQHVARLAFAHGRIGYCVVWIEQKAQADND
jgi:hypothetical protein